MERIYGLLGRRLGHSWSVPIHAACGCGGYRLIELEPPELEAFLRREDIGGLNVTIPYKREVLQYCDVIDPAARAIGSVNTLVRQGGSPAGGGKLYGYNTDIDGFLYMLRRADISLAGKKVLILGSGGASLTAQAAARQEGAEQIVVVSRSGPDNYENLPERHADAGVLINTTPVGMYPGCGVAPVEISLFPRLTGVLDVVYNPLRTALLMEAEARGIPASCGLPMLAAQAWRAAELFTGEDIPESRLEAAHADLLRQVRNVVLIGMPGCGKSTVGRALARRLGKEFLDLDQLVVEEARKSIPAIFAQEGEEAFRAMESRIVRRAGGRTGCVISTGGGVVTRRENYAPLHQNGVIVHLTRSLDLLPKAGRPVSQRTDLAALWRQREGLYRAFADAEADNNGPLEATLEQIEKELNAL